jgi:hypothetical protein
MAENVQVSCIRKRGNHHDPHERIEALGGVHHDKRWYLDEDTIIAELKKSDALRRWNFFTNVNGKSAWVVLAQHAGRDYLKTEPDKYPANNLLELLECPK